MPPPRQNRAYVTLLSALLTAFVLRVLAQLVQAYSDVAWLPPFEAWAAGGLPYPLLAAFQVIIIAAALEVIRKLSRGDMRPRRAASVWFLGLGAIYFVSMAFRLAAGLTFLADNAWFGASLPAIFHLVLAAFVLTLGHFHWSKA